jgi:hypothetical protein
MLAKFDFLRTSVGRVTARGWIAVVLLAAIVVLAVAWEAPTTKASGWPHDPVLFIPSLAVVLFCGVMLLFGPKFEARKQQPNG